VLAIVLASIGSCGSSGGRQQRVSHFLPNCIGMFWPGTVDWAIVPVAIQLLVPYELV